MRKILTLCAAAVFITINTLSAQSNVDVTLKNIHKINVSGNIILNIHKSDSKSLKGTIKNEMNELFSWSEKDGELKLKLKDPISFKKKERDSVTLNLYIDKFTTLSTSSQAEVYFANRFAIDVLNIDASSKSIVNAIVTAQTINIEGGSNANISVIGEAVNIMIKAGSNSYVNTVQTECATNEVLASTNAECYVRATKLLKLRANTSSTIFYKGVAEVIEKISNTFGKIEQF